MDGRKSDSTMDFSKLLTKRSPSLGDNTDFGELSKQFMNLNIREENRKNSLKDTTTTGNKNLVLQFKSYFDAKEINDKKKPKKSEKRHINTNFNDRFLFYDMLVPIFDFLKLNNRIFFRMIGLIEGCLAYENFRSLKIYRETTPANSQKSKEAFFSDWYSIAISCLLLSIQIEVSEPSFLCKKVSEYCRNCKDLSKYNLDWANITDSIFHFFLWNDGQISEILYSEVFSQVFQEKKEFGERTNLIRDVFEKTLILIICYDYEFYCQNKQTICNAVVYYCFSKIDQNFQKDLSHTSIFDEKETFYATEFRKSFKKMITKYNTVGGIVKDIERVFETLCEEGHKYNFLNWKYKIPDLKEDKDKFTQVLNANFL